MEKSENTEKKLLDTPRTQGENIYDVYKKNTQKTDIDAQEFEVGEVKHEEWFAAATCQQALNAVQAIQGAINHLDDCMCQLNQDIKDGVVVYKRMDKKEAAKLRRSHLGTTTATNQIQEQYSSSDCESEAEKDEDIVQRALR